MVTVTDFMSSSYIFCWIILYDSLILMFMWLCFCTYSSFSCLSFFRSNSYFLLYSSAISFEYFSNLILYPSPTLILILCASNSLNNSIYFLNFCSNSNSSFFLSNTLFLLMFYFCIKFMRYSWSTIISFCSNV